jgi:hypothetical protein
MQGAAAQQTITRDQIREQIRETIENSRIYQEEAQAAGVNVAPGAPVGIATTQIPPGWENPADMPPRVQETAIAFFVMIAVIFIGFPIARALARRIDRAGVSPRTPVEVTSQLTQLNQAVESIAVEVERISEGQRFTTKLLSDQHKLPTPARNIS